jgi:flavin-dependent dehydrogenase
LTPDDRRDHFAGLMMAKLVEKMGTQQGDAMFERGCLTAARRAKLAASILCEVLDQPEFDKEEDRLRSAHLRDMLEHLRLNALKSPDSKWTRWGDALALLMTEARVA